MTFGPEIITGIVTGLVTVGGTWGAVRVELRYHRRDIDRAHRRIDEVERQIYKPIRGGLYGEKA